MLDFNRISEYRENNRLEAKNAAGGLSQSIRETYSAFANTDDGVILLGVEEPADKNNFLDLLLLADESESMIDRYLKRGDLFALYDGGLKSVCVVTEEAPDACELKNIATYTEHQGKGYGSRLIRYISEFYKGKYKTMLVGTGDVPKSLRFYQKNGFEFSHRLRNFFTDNYDHQMFEDGVVLTDMVYLKREL